MPCATWWCHMYRKLKVSAHVLYRIFDIRWTTILTLKNHKNFHASSEDENLYYKLFNSSGIWLHVWGREKFSVSIFKIYDLDCIDPDDLGSKLFRKVSSWEFKSWIHSNTAVKISNLAHQIFTPRHGVVPQEILSAPLWGTEMTHSLLKFSQ